MRLSWNKKEFPPDKKPIPKRGIGFNLKFSGEYSYKLTEMQCVSKDNRLGDCILQTVQLDNKFLTGQSSQPTGRQETLPGRAKPYFL